MHLYSTLFTAQTVDRDFRNEAGLKRAAEWAKASGLHKVYVESYRDGLFVDKDLLESSRDYFENEGLLVHGCVTTTKLPKNSSDGGDSCCYTAPETRRKMKEIFERTASVFDVIMIDDFLFTTCKCPLCDAARGERSFDDYHSDVMHEMSMECILKPSHRINPRCKVIIKYPLWYEKFHRNGYDTVRQTRDFDLIWAGTETREPDSARWGRYPQTNAFYLMAWANRLGNGKCMGGWYDPLSTNPVTYLDQARQTVLAQAKESMLFCYDSLLEDSESVPGASDTEALRKEMPALRKLAYLTETKKITGVSVPKMPHDDPDREEYLASFYGMIGIPVVPDIAPDPDAPSVLLGTQAAGFPGIRDYLLTLAEKKVPYIVTAGFARKVGWPKKKGTILDIEKFGKAASSMEQNWMLVDFPEEELNALRDRLTKPLGLTLRAPSRVGLNLYDDDMEVLQNFNDHEVEVTLDLFGRSRKRRQVLLVLSDGKKVDIRKDGSVYTVKLPARTYAVLG